MGAVSGAELSASSTTARNGAHMGSRKKAADWSSIQDKGKHRKQGYRWEMDADAHREQRGHKHAPRA